MKSNNFEALGLSEPLLRALQDQHYETPTPIQEKSIPALIEKRDLLGIAQTGTGKTAAFSLPILHELADDWEPPAPKYPLSIILAPTRELAIQIGESIESLGRHLPVRHTVIFGGVSQKNQVKALQRGVDIVVATPGRLLDLMKQGHISLKHIWHFVLDEADRMLDMGFIHDVKKIIATLPKERQTLFFSATMPKTVSGLASTILRDPVRIEVTPQSTPVDRIAQSVYYAPSSEKKDLLTNILGDKAINKAIVFTRTKHRANRVAQQLDKVGISAAAIHGNKSQGARQKALKNFSSGEVRVLVATDIAARGIDIDSVSHVINFELPNIAEDYVHRIGRTARAGASGVAISLCEPSEQAYLRDIEKLMQHQLDVLGGQPAQHEPKPTKRGSRQSPNRRTKSKGYRGKPKKRTA
ncbi:ATP-dependent RNA helicase RhlE [Candidatus Terasakiella magnetica]|uniref:DEAD-box ATP-dependent RNA helicase RhpA n=1 Tax=Candidatus Terasakiella magnetica TaxID=1867952 RepID=A0A1C3RFK6_9PROT|nr:DEAD/DEAH box helicase [Candidatus Terasakiella magnetica]SCA55994.1 ATP-dependent RNA helicase RhlE [Candidatus Terasakiella magnetica]